MVNFKEIYHFSIFLPEGVQHFPMWSNFFLEGGGGVQLLIAYRNPYILRFSRGSGPPAPLWIRSLACASAQTDQRLCHSSFGKYHIYLVPVDCFASQFVGNPEDGGFRDESPIYPYLLICQRKGLSKSVLLQLRTNTLCPSK